MTPQATASLPLVKGALKDALKLRSGLSGVQVSWGTPTEMMPELIHLGDASGDQEAVSLGQRHREENYTLTVTCDVLRNDGDQEKATRRAYALAAELEDELRDNADLGLVQSGDLVLLIIQVAGPFALQEQAFEDSGVREATLEVTLSIKSRI